MDSTLVDAIYDFEKNKIATGSNIDLIQWFLSLFVLIILALFIQYTYNKYATTVSNHRSFSNLFLLFSLSTFLIISVIKVSLILSLGLVGALSIVRFRAAIKEPEQIVYLFLLIGISISVGANQLIIACIISLIAFIICHFISKSENELLNNCDYLKINFSSKLEDDKQNKLFDLIEKNKNVNNILRFIDDNSSTEITLNISFKNLDDLKYFKNELNKIDDQVTVSYISSNNV
tara:strand:+ start:340 stop:1038 length:699 start_codon:yes stop_codon:yes gene_type:complete